MEYLPGENSTPVQEPHQVAMEWDRPPFFSQSFSPPSPQPPAAMTVSMVEPSSMITPWQPQQTLPVSQQPLMQQNMVQQNPVQQPYSQTPVNMPNTHAAMSVAGNLGANALPGVQNWSNAQFSSHDRIPQSQGTPRHPESTIQLIDRGSVPSVDRFVNPTLPAVQPPTWGGEREEGRQESTDRAVSGFPSSYTSPLASQIEHASYMPNPRQPNMPSPLISPVMVEPNWTEHRNDSFEQVNDTPQVQANRDAVPPVRLPENMERPQGRVSNTNSEAVNLNSEACMLLLDTEELVLIRNMPETEWSWLPVSKQLTNDIVLIPAPFRAAFRFPNGIVVETVGDTRVQILPHDETGRPTLAFDCGHLTIYATESRLSTSGISQSLRIVTPVGGGVLRLTDTNSYVTIDSENKTTVKLLKVTRPYESVTANPVLFKSQLEANVVYCPNLMAFPTDGKTIYWQKDGNADEWKLGTASIFPMDVEKNTGPILMYNTSNLIVSPTVVWPSLVSHDGRIPISKLDLKNQFVTMPHTFYPTPSKTWLLK